MEATLSLMVNFNLWGVIPPMFALLVRVLTPIWEWTFLPILALIPFGIEFLHANGGPLFKSEHWTPPLLVSMFLWMLSFGPTILVFMLVFLMNIVGLVKLVLRDREKGDLDIINGLKKEDKEKKEEENEK